MRECISAAALIRGALIRLRSPADARPSNYRLETTTPISGRTLPFSNATVNKNGTKKRTVVQGETTDVFSARKTLLPNVRRKSFGRWSLLICSCVRSGEHVAISLRLAEFVC
ncbi:hypothetical protein CEXT_653181 [Caerostris extrusa]|uniref:Secreted protein n=1 Tax=Caerostris extrusa TaxID=172846 RepID=A0AAV4WBW6_CAEEX|nr:hypothetical protein CEXT_653181 [Caerostris extrusa]